MFDVVSELRRQQLERNFSVQPEVVSQVNFTHATGAELADYLVIVDLVPWSNWIILGKHFSSDVTCRFCEAISRVSRDQGFDFASQLLIITTRFDQKIISLRRITDQGFVK
jgi:hypothetical protein